MADSAGTGEVDGPRLLDSVREAFQGYPDLGSRPRVSAGQWDGLDAAGRRAYLNVGITAVRRFAGYRTVAGQIRALGQLRYEPTVDVLTGLFADCPVEPIRIAAAHALFSIGTSKARAALRAGIDDCEHFDRFMAVKTMLTDEGTPWDNAGSLFSRSRLSTAAGRSAADIALRFLSPSSFSRTGDRWYLNELRDLLSRDRRWLDLCVSLRDHADLGRPARQALEYAGPAVTGPALDAAAAARAAQARPRGPRLAAGSLIDRYQRGDHRGVWHDLGAAGPLDAAWRAEAEQVAALTMQRVRRNAEHLVTALIAKGWPVTAEKALPGPAPDAGERLQQLEQLTGTAVPPALAAFWRIVGPIDLVPRGLWDAPFPDGIPEPLAAADPLEVIDLAEAWFGVEEWQEKSARLHPEITGPVELVISADYLHKANISGGGPYCIWLPFTGADPIVRNEEHGLSFTDYLRLAFEGKGFLRAGEELERVSHGADRDQQADTSGWLASVEYDQAAF
jgi:HEAT repeat protein